MAVNGDELLYFPMAQSFILYTYNYQKHTEDITTSNLTEIYKLVRLYKYTAISAA